MRYLIHCFHAISSISSISSIFASHPFSGSVKSESPEAWFSGDVCLEAFPAQVFSWEGRTFAGRRSWPIWSFSLSQSPGRRLPGECPRTFFSVRKCRSESFFDHPQIVINSCLLSLLTYWWDLHELPPPSAPDYSTSSRCGTVSFCAGLLPCRMPMQTFSEVDWQHDVTI